MGKGEGVKNCWGQHTMAGTAHSRPEWSHLRSPWQLLKRKDGVWDPEKRETHPSREPTIRNKGLSTVAWNGEISVACASSL